MRPFLFCAILLVAGCQRPAGAGGGRPVSIRGLMPAEEHALQAGTHPLPPDGIVVLTKSRSSDFEGFMRGLTDAGISQEVGDLRNPGAIVFLLPGRKQPPLTLLQRATVETLAVRHKMRIVEGGRIPVRFGPDGRTPMVQRYVDWTKRGAIPLATVTIPLRFPDLATAKEARRYIDPQGYKVRLVPEGKGVTLYATCSAPEDDANEELTGFEPLAARFGIKADTVETRTTSTTVSP
ncbi:MAG: hypothetical protein ACO1SV_03975 [Fimbriimonas sp.]